MDRLLARVAVLFVAVVLLAVTMPASAQDYRPIKTQVDPQSVKDLIGGALQSDKVRDLIGDGTVRIAVSTDKTTHVATVIDGKLTQVRPASAPGSAEFTIKASEAAALSLLNAIDQPTTAKALLDGGYIVIAAKNPAKQATLKALLAAPLSSFFPQGTATSAADSGYGGPGHIASRRGSSTADGEGETAGATDDSGTPNARNPTSNDGAPDAPRKDDANERTVVARYGLTAQPVEGATLLINDLGAPIGVRVPDAYRFERPPASTGLDAEPLLGALSQHPGLLLQTLQEGGVANYGDQVKQAAAGDGDPYALGRAAQQDAHATLVEAGLLVTGGAP